MNWRPLTVSSLVFLAGCATEQSAISPASLVPPVPIEARSQNPDLELTVAKNVPIEGTRAVSVRALVNGVPILDDELKQATYQSLVQTERLPEPERTETRNKIVRAELDKLVERELILSTAFTRLGKNPKAIEKLKEAAAKEFEKQIRSMKQRAAEQGFKCESDEQFVELLEQQGLSLDALRRQSERGFMAMEFMRHLIFSSIERGITHQAIRDYYDEHAGEFQSEDRVKWQDIFIASNKYATPAEAKRMADDLAARARKGEDFAELSKKHDDGDSGLYRQGAGLGSKRGEIRPPELESILFRMREGEVGPVVETFNGYHVLKLQEREYAGLHPFDEKTQQEIKKKLQGIIADREYKRIVNELKYKATVQFVEE